MNSEYAESVWEKWMNNGSDQRTGPDLLLSEVKAALSAQSKELEELREENRRNKARGDNHWETLRGIRDIARTGDYKRIILWVNDAGSGYVETAEATQARLMDELASLRRRLAEAEEDVARIEFMQSSVQGAYCCYGRQPKTDGSWETESVFEGWAVGMNPQTLPKPTLREAIDSAIQAAKDQSK